MKFRFLAAAILISSASFADSSVFAKNGLHEAVIRTYLQDIQKADYQDIDKLFTNDAIVISTSHGKLNAKTFFNAFLPSIQSASTELHQTYLNIGNDNRNAARFHLAFKLKNGESANGEYMDEFIFEDNSSKLKAVYMFENLKFGN